MFDKSSVCKMASIAGAVLTIDHARTDPDGLDPLDVFAGALNECVKLTLPDGAPSYALSQGQAEIIRDMFAPNWAMQSIKIAAFEALAHLPMYAPLFGTEKAYREVQSAREAVMQMNAVLSSFTDQQPAIDIKHFIQFAVDPATRIAAPLYNHLMALQYAEAIVRRWREIPMVTGEAR